MTSSSRLERSKRRARGALLPALPVAISLLLLLPAAHAVASVVARAQIEDGAVALLRDGRNMLLECHPPSGSSARPFLQKYLDNTDSWKAYEGRRAVAIPYENLKPEIRRLLLLTVFKYDYVDEDGWTHYVLFDGDEDQETLWTLCTWLTGKGGTYKQVMSHNGIVDDKLKRGQRIFFPAEVLRDEMKPVTARRPNPPGDFDLAPVRSTTQQGQDDDEDDGIEPEASFLSEGSSELTYGKDGKGEYAMYRLKKGEALYTDVVARFTDVDVTQDAAKIILESCEVVKRRSGIKDERSIPDGAPILIPMEMLSPRFQPEGSSAHAEYQETVKEAKLLRGKVRSKDLEGVVVVLDPGHGGEDTGAETCNSSFTLYEDEINYDIVCRIKGILESSTRAKVYVTMLDRSQGYTPTSKSAFSHDEDEVLLTSPQFPNTDPGTSATLRWYLANSYYRQELDAGTNKDKIIFTSIHCDALYKTSLRGAMIYTPGAGGRRDKEPSSLSKKYTGYKEVKAQPYATSTASERRRDEAMSTNFAETLLKELGMKRVKRHDKSPPIRSVIRRDGKAFVPAVLRNTMIPTKVLVECANMTNDVDCSRLADPEWRQLFAEAYVNALNTHFSGQ